MDLLQKYTEAETFYELDEAVIETIDMMSPVKATRIIQQIQKAVTRLERKNYRSQIIGCVLSGSKPVYFALRYIYEEWAIFRQLLRQGGIQKHGMGRGFALTCLRDFLSYGV